MPKQGSGDTRAPLAAKLARLIPWSGRNGAGASDQREAAELGGRSKSELMACEATGENDEEEEEEEGEEEKEEEKRQITERSVSRCDE